LLTKSDPEGKMTISMSAKRFEVLPKEQPEVSKPPSGARPVRYTRYKPTEEPLKGVTGHESPGGSDLEDLWTFEVNNPHYRDKADAIMESRFRKQEATGMTFDLVHLKIATDRIAKGLAKGGDKYLSIYQFIPEKYLYETLLSYLEHLSKLKEIGVEEILQKVRTFQGLTKDQADLLLKYLLDRENYLMG
jgi:hypothetical protein